MLEWTGERFLPWIKQSTIAYEHLHRYAYAKTLVKNKRVLDLACGEGYGSKLLASTASSVVGIDIDENVVGHASEKYGCETLRFLTGSMTAVPIQENHRFDVIVCFEAIEHIENQDGVLTEAKRLLAPDGLLIVSTPNKPIYGRASPEQNPFHARELHFTEFEELLGRYFRNLKFLGQRVHPASSIWPIGSPGANGFHEFIIERASSEFEFIGTDKRVPLYFLAVASDAAVSPPSSSVLLDDSDCLLDELKEGLDWLHNSVDEMEKTIASQQETLAWRDGQVRSLTDQLQKTQDSLALIHASRGWKLILRLRSIRDRLRGLAR